MRGCMAGALMALFIAAFGAAFGQGPVHRLPIPESPRGMCAEGVAAPGTIARSRAEKERAVALGTPGVRVCRRMTVGIATHDWVRGVVVALEGEKLAVRIDDAGRFDHAIGGRALVKGEMVRDSVQSWIPCE